MFKKLFNAIILIICLTGFSGFSETGYATDEFTNTIRETNVEILGKVNEGRDVEKGSWSVFPEYNELGQIIRVFVWGANNIETFIVSYNSNDTFSIEKITETIEQYNNTIKVKINGKRVLFDVQPSIINGRTLVPMRTIFEALGYSIDWNEPRQRVVATKDDSVIQLDIGDNVAILNNYYSAYELDVAPQIIDGRTMVPLRFVAEAANYDVIWEESTKTAYIETIFDGDIFPRPNQSVAMLDDAMVWTHGIQVSNDGRIFDKVDFANSNSLQVYDGYIYYRDTELKLCRANIDTHATERLTIFPIANVLVSDNKLYYSKIEDNTHALFRSNINGSKEEIVVDEPCGDYRVFGSEIFYIHLISHNLKRANLITGETKTMYDGFTTCFDIYKTTHDVKIYYCMAEYEDENTPLSYRGVKQYSLYGEYYVLGEMLEGVAIDNMWVLGNNFFYEVPIAGGKSDVYRKSLDYRYNVKILRAVLGGTEFHGKRIFYYPAENTYPYAVGAEGEPVLYVANTRGTNGFPLKSLVFSTIATYGIDQNKPDDSVFDEYLERDIDGFVLETYGGIKFDYRLLSKNPEGDMNGGCRYYVWLYIYSEDGSLLESGVVIASAKNKDKFIIEGFRTKADIASGKMDINAFPIVIRKRILELAE